MAQTTIVRLIDDLDGSEATSTVRFGMDGVLHEIDLNEANELRLRGLLEPFVKAGRRVGRNPAGAPRRQPMSSREELARIRQWAVERGIPVKWRGRVAQAVKDRYYREVPS
jgi:hypothetical protein